MISSQDYEQLCLWLRSAPGLTVAGVFGAIWGSFANVCIYRIPRGESLVRPGSHCPGCQAEIAWYDNLPILSWLLLAGRCRRCRAVIPLQYPLVEALLLGLALLLYRRFVWDDGGPMGIALSRFVTYFFFSLTLVVLSVIDLRTLLLPDRITYPAIPLFFLLGRVCGQTSLTDAALGLAAGYAVIWLIATLYRRLRGSEGLGLGDAKLLSLIGGLLGWHALPWTLFLGSVSGLLLSLPLLIIRRRHEAEGSLLHSEVPFGPFLSLAALIYVVFFVGRDPLAWLADRLPSWV
jgi:leader peptidase (prepilin peptidase)/N-methyltransferase